MRVWIPSGKSSSSCICTRTRARSLTSPCGTGTSAPKMTSWEGTQTWNTEYKQLCILWPFPTIKWGPFHPGPIHRLAIEPMNWTCDMTFTETICTCRSSVDLSKLQREVSHQIWLNLEDGAGKLLLIVTISGNFQSNFPHQPLLSKLLEVDEKEFLKGFW